MNLFFSTKQPNTVHERQDEQWCHTLQDGTKECACKASLNLILLSEQNVKLELLHVQYIHSPPQLRSIKTAWGKRCRLLPEVDGLNPRIDKKSCSEFKAVSVRKNCPFFSQSLLHFTCIYTVSWRYHTFHICNFIFRCCYNDHRRNYNSVSDAMAHLCWTLLQRC